VLIAVVAEHPHQHLGYFGLVFDFSHSTKYVVVSHYGFNLCFSNDE